MYRKRFSKELHNQHDAVARQIVADLDLFADVHLGSHPNKYEIDLIDRENKVVVEVEQRPAWKSHNFPFNSLNVPERKEKMLRKWLAQPDWEGYFAAVNAKGTKVAVVSAKEVLSSPLRQNVNKYDTGKVEKFFQVPYSKLLWSDV